MSAMSAILLALPDGTEVSAEFEYLPRVGETILVSSKDYEVERVVHTLLEFHKNDPEHVHKIHTRIDLCEPKLIEPS